ncbi:hypothetical protein [Blastococcus sp. VKM Ac-2987]|uniref:hypothetical protein n=1 Tax=Blastococcus sp. VKM Ac-2987 TaxID=3004141 RepID=UPI0022AB7F95|nr:hypothetical protein [Blastococcus sp. VKM Ac-2987]MCZ2860853.1 hypothetical protein [Blastococcus sp. VKM Ac-2987]
MPTAHVTAELLRVHFHPAEKIAGLLRDLEIPITAVRSVDVVPDGLRAAVGIRAPGLGVPGLRKIGTWRRKKRKTVVAVRRGRPALRLTLAHATYDALLLEVADPEATAAAISAAR